MYEKNSDYLFVAQQHFERHLLEGKVGFRTKRTSI